MDLDYRIKQDLINYHYNYTSHTFFNFHYLMIIPKNCNYYSQLQLHITITPMLIVSMNRKEEEKEFEKLETGNERIEEGTKTVSRRTGWRGYMQVV